MRCKAGQCSKTSTTQDLPHLDSADIIYDKPNNMKFVIKWKVFNIILLQLLMVLLDGHQRKNCTKNWALNIYIQEDG